MTKITWEKKGYLKGLSHGAKHPWSSVSGVLVGQTDETGSNITIVDAFPLFHLNAPLPSPALLKAALSQLSDYVSSSLSTSSTHGSSLVAIGAYGAVEDASVSDLPLWLKRLSIDAVSAFGSKSINSRPVAALIAGKASLVSGCHYRVWTGAGGVNDSWSGESAADLTVENSIREDAVKVLASPSTVASIIDWDDHVADLSKSWLN